MTKQEEIREGIATRLEIAYNTGLSKRTCNTNEMARQAVAQLHSQGVAIKVEGELPEITFPSHVNELSTVGLVASAWYDRCQQDMLKAGYVKTEPLIEE